MQLPLTTPNTGKRRSRWVAHVRWTQIILSLYLGFAHVPKLHAEQQKVDEYKVKAAFVYNFLKFTRWPASLGSKEPLLLGIPSSPEIKTAFAAIDGRHVGERHIKLRIYQSLADAQGCHVLFLPDTLDRALHNRLLTGTENQPVLTIGETPGFLAAGGIIQFLSQNNQMRFAIHLGDARERQLEFSAQLLELAVHVIQAAKQKGAP